MKLKGIWANKPPYTQLLVLVILVFISTIALSSLSLALIEPLFGISVFQMQSAMGDLTKPANLAMLKVLQVVQAIGAFIIPPFVWAYICSPNAASTLRVNKKPTLLFVICAIVLIAASQVLIGLMSEWNKQMHFPQAFKNIEVWMQNLESQGEVLTKAFLQGKTIVDLLINLFVIALLPAIGEELLFRAAVQPLLKKLVGNIHVAIFLTAIIFSAIHMQFYGFLPRMFMGVILGYAYYWSGTLWIPIVMHLINNGLGVISFWLGYNDSENSFLPWYWNLLGFAFTSIAIIVMQQNQKEELISP